jgi:glutathione S-transferase
MSSPPPERDRATAGRQLPQFPLRTLASHPLCPFLQRVVLTALVKGYVRGQDFSPRYHPVGDAPDWFLALSPARRDPVFELRDGHEVVFDTRVAAALVDEVSGPALADSDPFVRARERELVAHAQFVLDSLRGVFVAKDELALQQSLARVFEGLAALERQGVGRERYHGSAWSQVDCAYGPVFSLMWWFRPLRELSAWSALPRVRLWASVLAEDPLVVASRCEAYGNEFEKFFTRVGSRFPELIGSVA